MPSINYPTSLDDSTSIPTPTRYDQLDLVGYRHEDNHDLIIQAILALEAKLGITGSGVTGSLDYRVTVLEALIPASGTGSPEGVVSGSPGKTYLDVTSDPPSLWAKYTGTGNTGWRQLIA